MNNGRRDVALASLALFCLAFWVSCEHLSESGLLWPDSSQYLNAAAMIHDWFRSGDWLHPYQFAVQNYIRYPAFHIPYHPPAYPAMLGTFFLVTGVSYEAARVFVALCLCISGWAFFGILRRLGHGVMAALLSAALLITLPEIAYWSRDAMSEIPALALTLLGTYFFVRWIDTERPADYIGSFFLAEAAFLSRYLAAGILPAWFLWMVFAGKARRLRSPLVIGMPLLYCAINVVWTIFTRQYSLHETSSGELGPAINYTDALSMKSAAFYALSLPQMTGWPVLLAALGGVLFALAVKLRNSSLTFWLAWLAAYTLFVLIVGIYSESRYFIFALPAFPGLIAQFFAGNENFGFRRYAAVAICVICLAWNIYVHSRVPLGTVGDEKVAEDLANRTEPGNVLIDMAAQAQVMFAYRSKPVAQTRRFIRVDRTLAIRPPTYSKAHATIVARDVEDVMDTVRLGRIRYVVVARSAQNEEVILLTKVLGGENGFELLREFPIKSTGPDGVEVQTVQLWRFTGILPDGPSSLLVVVPTGSLNFEPVP